MRESLALKGKRFGRLKVLKRVPNIMGHSSLWLCRCDCGKQKEVLGKNLNNKKAPTISCGCFQREMHFTHRHWGTPEYWAYWNMLQRCYYPRQAAFRHYGGRGITVCPRWIESFDNFLADMGHRPRSKPTLDRINVNGNYEPGNCRWATWKEQANNKRKNLARATPDGTPSTSGVAPRISTTF